MHRKILLGLAGCAAVAFAAPAMAKGKAAAAEPQNAGPIPYSELAAADAKLNGAGPKAKHHAAKKKTAEPAAAAKADVKPAQ